MAVLALSALWFSWALSVTEAEALPEAGVKVIQSATSENFHGVSKLSTVKVSEKAEEK